MTTVILAEKPSQAQAYIDAFKSADEKKDIMLFEIIGTLPEKL